MSDSNINVSVRIRPFNSSESATNTAPVARMSDNILHLTDPVRNSDRTFAFDNIFWSFDTSKPYSTQDDVYETIGKPAMDALWKGMNSSIFAYGQTSSGKTYTLFGSSSHPGLVPLFSKNLFHEYTNLEPSEQKSVSLHVSVLEVYNEIIHDLLDPSNKARLVPRQCKTLGVVVPKLTRCKVESEKELQKLINLSHKNRAVASTTMNSESSRSHCIVKISLTRKFQDGTEIASETNLIDLAGSERQSKTNASGARLREAANINKSLLALGNVVQRLSDAAKNPNRKSFISYRSSVLTHLLSNSLGGNSLTFIIVAISPAGVHYGETLGALQFAARARQIPVKPVVNVCPKIKMINELKEEISELKKNLSESNKAQQNLLEDYNEILAMVTGNEKEEKDKTIKLIEDDDQKSLFLTIDDFSDLTSLEISTPFLVSLPISFLFGNSSTLDGVFVSKLSASVTRIGYLDNSDIRLSSFLGSKLKSSFLEVSVDDDQSFLIELVDDYVVAVNNKWLSQGNTIKMNSGDVILIGPCFSDILIFIDPQNPPSEILPDSIADFIAQLTRRNCPTSELIKNLTRVEFLIEQGNFLCAELGLAFDLSISICSTKFSNSDEVSSLQIKVTDFSTSQSRLITIDCFESIIDDLTEAYSALKSSGIDKSRTIIKENDIVAELSQIPDELLGTFTLKIDEESALKKGTFMLQLKSNVEFKSSSAVSVGPSLSLEYTPVLNELNLISAVSLSISDLSNIDPKQYGSLFLEFNFPHADSLEMTSRLPDLWNGGDFGYCELFYVDHHDDFLHYLSSGIEFHLFGHSNIIAGRPTEQMYKSLLEYSESLEEERDELKSRLEKRCCSSCCGCSLM
ncbi:hypothetical protein P9112_011424 [Eukaryota sp. TZLM1-RC]